MEGWPDHADPGDVDHASVPAATRPSTFLEAACKTAGPGEVLMLHARTPLQLAVRNSQVEESMAHCMGTAPQLPVLVHAIVHQRLSIDVTLQQITAGRAYAGSPMQLAECAESCSACSCWEACCFSEGQSKHRPGCW